MTRFFGERWDAPRVDDAAQVATPVGERCLHCDEPIEPGDRGLLTPSFLGKAGDDGYEWVMRAVHLECELSSTLSHAMGQCRTCHVDHPTIRPEARATLGAVNEQRQARGLGPL